MVITFLKNWNYEIRNLNYIFSDIIFLISYFKYYKKWKKIKAVLFFCF